MMICRNSNNEEIRVSFEYMYDTYKNVVRCMVQKGGYDSDLLDDIIQEIFFKFYKSMGHVQGEEAARKWLITITHNEIINHCKSETVYRRHVLFDFDEEKLADVCYEAAGDIIETTIKKELGSKVREKIRQLKPRQQEVIVLKYYYEYSAKEIAYMLKCPLNTVYSRLKKSEKILKKICTVLYANITAAVMSNTWVRYADFCGHKALKYHRG